MLSSSAAPEDLSPPPPTAPSSAGGELGVLDYTLVVLLTLLSILVGTVKAVKENRHNSANDYLLGGRSMSIIPVALSLLGGFVSALSMLGYSMEVYFYGTQFYLVCLGCVWGILLITNLVMPVFYPLQLVSVYEYLEMRFASPVLRRCASLTQIFNMIFFLGMCLYAPSLALSTVTGIPTWAPIVFNGLLCTIYITIGGVRAVVYTDVLQTSLMFLGTVIIVSKVAFDYMSLETIWEISKTGGRIEFFNLDPSPLVRNTFWSVQFFGAHIMLSLIVFSQAQFQRLVSVSSLQAANRVCYIFLVGLIVLWALFGFSGLVAYAIYVDCDPVSAGQVEKKDGILPYLVLDKLGNGNGLVGLFVASIYGGVLSSVSSNANAVAALLWKDFLCDLRIFSKMSDTASTSTIKVLSALGGLSSIGMAMVVGSLGSILEITWRVGAALLSPLDGVFLTAIIAPWVTTKGAVIGFFSALSFNIFCLVGRLLQGEETVETLPLSVDGCQSDFLLENAYYGDHNATLSSAYYGAHNATLSSAYYGAYNTTMSSVFYGAHNLTAATTMESGNESSRWAIFDLSYCYSGPLGVFIVFVVATFVSCASGLTNPKLQDQRLVHPACFRFYERVFDFVGKYRTPNSQPSEGLGEGEGVKEQQQCLNEPCIPLTIKQQDCKENGL